MEQSHLSSQIGKRIKLYRKQQKMTLEDLAACINRSKASVSKYECGAIVLDVETLYEIAGALQVPLSCLMEIPEERADNRAISAKEMLPSRLYFYIYRDRGTREIACSYLDVIAQPECCQAVLYYDLAPGEPKKTNRIYMGDAFVTDTTFSFLVTNYQNRLDQMYFTSSRPYINRNDCFVGFWIGLTFENVAPVCMKAVISEKPIGDQEKINELLAVTQSEIAYFRKKNKFLLQNDI